MLQTNVVENENTHFTFKKFFFRKSCRYEKMWKNVVVPNRPQTVTQYRACAFKLD